MHAARQGIRAKYCTMKGGREESPLKYKSDSMNVIGSPPTFHGAIYRSDRLTEISPINAFRRISLKGGFAPLLGKPKFLKNGGRYETIVFSHLKRDIQATSYPNLKI